MSDATEILRGKIASTGDLQSVVRTMKALAASNIGQCNSAVRALSDYHRTVELGLCACLGAREAPAAGARAADRDLAGPARAVVFGSDQGLVGQFNEAAAQCALETLARQGAECKVWAVGERVYEHLAEAHLPLAGLLPVPNSVQAITPLIGRILIEMAGQHDATRGTPLWVFHNRPLAGSLYEPAAQRLLPLDRQWYESVTRIRWPTANRPEILGDAFSTLRAIVREYLFISLYRACAESMASENASRLAAMNRADKNIGDMLERLLGEFHQLRQSGIDEELFDVISGFEALSAPD